MAYEITNKVVHPLLLCVGNAKASNKQIIAAKQNDINSHFLQIKFLGTNNERITTDNAIVRLNAALPNGKHIISYGEKINGEDYIKIYGSLLKQTGTVSCDISLIGDYAQASVVSTTLVGVKVDSQIFGAEAMISGNYEFIYDGFVWTLNNEEISLADYGIAITDTLKEGDTVLIEFNTQYVLSTETFYIIVQKSNYSEHAEIGEENESFLDYIIAGLGSKEDFETFLKSIILDVTQNNRFIFTDTTNPTESQISQFVQSMSLEAPFIGIEVVVDKTYHVWHYNSTTNMWQDDGCDTFNDVDIDSRLQELVDTKQTKVVSGTDEYFISNTVEGILQEVGEKINTLEERLSAI